MLTGLRSALTAILTFSLRAEAARLEHVLRFSRENAIIKGSAVTVDVAALCDRLTPSSPLMTFFPDGSADGFFAWGAQRGRTVRVHADPSGRIRVRLNDAGARPFLAPFFKWLPNVSSEEARAALTLLCRDMRPNGDRGPVSYHLRKARNGKQELWRDEVGRRAFLAGNIVTFESRPDAAQGLHFFRLVTSEHGEHHEAVAIARDETGRGEDRRDPRCAEGRSTTIQRGPTQKGSPMDSRARNQRWHR